MKARNNGTAVGVVAPWSVAFPGVRYKATIWYDVYLGSAGDLVAAGLVRADHLPGAPGMRKVRVTIYADGVVADGPRNDNKGLTQQPGARQIDRGSASTYRVRVVVTSQQRQARADAERAADAAWVRQVGALARPAQLGPLPRVEQRTDLAAFDQWLDNHPYVALARYESACVAAARDVVFQEALARIVRGASR